jgi:hypothetical protein
MAKTGTLSHERVAHEDGSLMSMLREYLRSSARPYLFALILAVVLGGLAEYLYKFVWHDLPVIYGQEPGVYITAAGVAVAAVLWLLYRGERTRQPLLGAFMILLLVAWATDSLLSRIHGDSMPYTVLLYVPVVLGLWWKTPTRDDVRAGLWFLGWSIATILIVVRALELRGLIPPIDVGSSLLSFEIGNYWLPLSDTLGPAGRWHGPFGHAARTGAASAFLIVLASGLRTRSRWVFAIVGVLGLLLTASRGSLFAAAAGVLAIFVLGDNPLTRRVRRVWVFAGLGAIALAGAVVVLVQNPNLTGRTTYWTVAIDVWQQSPATGVGTSGMQASELAMAGTNAHNIVFDSLVKYGVIGLLPVIALLIIAAVLALRCTNAGDALPVGIIAAYLVLGMSEADTEWMSMTLPWLWLVLATLLAGRTVEAHNRRIPALSSAGT